MLLLLPGVLQTASNQTGQAEVPEQCGLQCGGLRGEGEQQEVYRLQVPEVHPHRHGSGTGSGERKRETIFRYLDNNSYNEGSEKETTKK